MSIDAFRRELLSFCDSEGLLAENAKILCAVSGGADSVCMLDALSALGLDVCCAHFNHRLRGDESDRDARFVGELCRGLGLELRVGQGEVSAFAAEHGLGVEEAARELRYAFLERAAAELGADLIATAHNADDNLETMLMNLARGSGSRGLAGIPPKRGRIIRPLLFATRERIERYLQERGLDFVTDSTNDSDDYTRNRLRHHALPPLREANAAAAENALRAARLLRQDDELLCRMAEEFLLRHGGVNIPALLEQPLPVSSRVLRAAAGVSLSQGQIEDILALCRSGKPSAKLSLPGTGVQREYDTLLFGEREPPPIPETRVEIGGITELLGTGLSVSAEIVEHCPEVHKSLNTFSFQIESLCGNITVRQRAEGDKIRLSGRAHSRSLKKLFIDAKIPLSGRRAIPVIADESGVIAVAGFGVSHYHEARPGERALVLSVTEKQNVRLGDLP